MEESKPLPENVSGVGSDSDQPRSPVDVAADDGYMTGWSLGILVLALGLALFLVALDMTIISTAIPSITKEFHSIDSQGWYGSAFFLTDGATQASWGKIYRFFPLKICFIISMAVFEAGSLICALANWPIMLIVGRAIAGVGAAGVASGAYTILAVSAAPRIRGSLTAIFGMSYAFASFVGPLLGGVFTTETTWRWCFWINLPIGGLALAAILFLFTPPVGPKPEPATWISIFKQVDLTGVMLLTSTMICYLLAMEWGVLSSPGVTVMWWERLLGSLSLVSSSAPGSGIWETTL
ncbi:MFS general substrate transporter [Penicillium macrosclerotiorum]|uniref:MFS general substrate transporter n=1 Tax=Penicillium macrosclerotiorum TaxID=303699 RepID=UPI00254712E0|nr:MFS general substrate transporter [Penicillium macrosclerotiorum]KAJ5673931.1 MFS general substrate transporter [Penicillium macrosclerotiorum]